MLKTILLFDMDGVLLHPRGYHTALQKSVAWIGAALGAPNTTVSADQIARFEAMGVTNEWDSLAICAALTLLHIWPIDPTIRLNELAPKPAPLSDDAPDFDTFLTQFQPGIPEPCLDALSDILRDYPDLDEDQKKHLTDILTNPRELRRSITLPIFQEVVLGSETFARMYNLPPQLNTKSYLLTYDRPVMSANQYATLLDWLSASEHAAGILTNRPNTCPPGGPSSPEAELGAQCVRLADLPLMGSSMLTWYARVRQDLHGHVYLKPHPVHALSLLGLILGWQSETALARAAALADGKGDGADWRELDGAHIVVFEDSTKGLEAGRAAQAWLARANVETTLECIGVTTHPDKRAALENVADRIVPDINAVRWEDWE
jgi:hypothetical protein